MNDYKTYLLNNYFRNTTPSGENKTPTLFTPKEGYEKGNLFSNLYDSYKNYKPASLVASNEQDALFLELSQNSFAAHDLNLYLDLHPDDVTMLALFNDYRTKTNQLMNEYEQKYGPLTVSSEDNSTNFLWESKPWPWEGGNV